MRKYILMALVLGLAVFLPALAGAALPEPSEVEVVDVNNDNGTNIGVLWRWVGAPTEQTRLWILVEADRSLLEQYELTSAQSQRLQDAVDKLQAALHEPRDRYDGRSILEEFDAAAEAMGAAQQEFQLAEVNKADNTAELRRAYWRAKNRFDAVQDFRNKFRDRLHKSAGPLAEKQKFYDYLSATLDAGDYIPTGTVKVEAAKVPTKGRYTNRFGHDPAEGDKLYIEVSEIKPYHGDVLNGTFQSGAHNDYDEEISKALAIPFTPGTQYNLQMVVYEQEEGNEKELEFTEVMALDDKIVASLGAQAPRVNYFDASKVNNFIFALAFAAIILIAIMLARRNPNLFIRRISGLEAVDEAIGRATEMGKPVLYLTGLDPLSNLATLAAINILGRVARKIADYESELLVPQRDPVAMTVCQEVVRESYLDAGRPDAYREDNIFFVTEDQFSFTATTCAIMMRERPAANFFMGYYYAESLLLAETGAATGAIQIAGTDALHQLPFFIVTCDYTLIGEELYAASAYLSREPMLLGSLKGQDVGKGLIMIVIVLQTLLFLFSPEWNWIKLLVEPL